MTATDIQLKLTNISNAIDTILSGGESYTLNDGQGIMSVKRTTLKDLNSAYDFWDNKLKDLTGSGFVSLRSVR